MDRSADPLAGIRRYAVDFHRRARHWTVGLNPAWRTCHKATEFDLRFLGNRDAVRFAASDEFIDLAKCAWRKRRLAMIDRAEHEIGCALQRRAFRRDPGWRAWLGDEAAVFLGIFVDAVAAQRQERRARRHLALAFVEPAQERTAAVELTAETIVPIIDAVVGYAAQYGMADIASAAVLDIAADRITAAGIADQSHARRPGAALQLLDGVAEFAALILGRGSVWLRHCIVGSRQRIGEIDRKHPAARNPVRFHPPPCGDPQGGVVAIAMHEQNGRNLRCPRGSRRSLRKGCESEVAGCQRQNAGSFQ